MKQTHPQAASDGGAGEDARRSAYSKLSGVTGGKN